MGHFYDNFLKTLEKRYPRKADLVNALMDILPLEKESIYRRLRKDILFTAEETMRIANVWNISLDTITSLSPDITRPFCFHMIEYLNPKEVDYSLLEKYNSYIEIAGKDPEGKMIQVTKTLPRALYSRSEALTQFFTMKWLYDMSGDTVAFGNIKIPERMRAMDLQYVDNVNNIQEIYALHDSRFIENLVGDINYFRSVKMITEDEVALLKDELLRILDFMEDAMTNGRIPETGTKLYVYLAHTWLEIEYVLYESKSLNLSGIKVLERNVVYSLDKEVLNIFMNMFQALKRSSVLTSESSLLVTEFCTKHREIINSL